MFYFEHFVFFLLKDLKKLVILILGSNFAQNLGNFFLILLNKNNNSLTSILRNVFCLSRKIKFVYFSLLRSRFKIINLFLTFRWKLDIQIILGLFSSFFNQNHFILWANFVVALIKSLLFLFTINISLKCIIFTSLITINLTNGLRIKETRLFWVDAWVHLYKLWKLIIHAL